MPELDYNPLEVLGLDKVYINLIEQGGFPGPEELAAYIRRNVGTLLPPLELELGLYDPTADDIGGAYPGEKTEVASPVQEGGLGTGKWDHINRKLCEINKRDEATKPRQWGPRIKEMVRKHMEGSRGKETKEHASYLKEQVEAASDVLGATTEQIIGYVEGLGIEPVYTEGPVDTEPTSPEVRATLLGVAHGLDPRNKR